MRLRYFRALQSIKIGLMTKETNETFEVLYHKRPKVSRKDPKSHEYDQSLTIRGSERVYRVKKKILLFFLYKHLDQRTHKLANE